MSKLASEYVANILNDWYMAIKQQNVGAAEKYFKESRALFDEMEEDQEVLMYYSLLEERHKMMLHQDKGKEFPKHSYFSKKHKKEIRKTDNMIEYYFFLFEALYESHNRNYGNAISLFKIAEKKLANIPDEIEAAEFYSKVASLYMMLGQNIVSLNYIKDAMHIYKRNEDYKKKLATSMMVVGHNYTELGQYDKAEDIYFEAIRISKQLEDTFFEAMIHHNLSITYSAAKKSQDCINALKKALRNDEWKESVYYINSLYMIIKEFFIMGLSDQAVYYYKKAQENLNQKENKVYEAKINIIYELFQKTPEDSVNQCRSYIHFLFEQNDADSVHDLALIISQYYEAKGYIQEALEFSNHAILAERKMKQLEGV
ncbi:Rap family tetratricopeptide repeat protein [Bacillus sp. SKDU12]|uniref:Rap family tetratricopeptide repeat protein n=1 Tax=Bacillus sp. SKDU12 TaxID=1337053 RepID=UPI00138A429A|nr:aspartate phosphatase [Bacillus sp. SKDU12]